MPRIKRYASRCSSTPSQPLDVLVGSRESVPEPFPRNDYGAKDDSSPSTEPNRPLSQRESNRYWSVNLKDENGEIAKARLRVYDVFVLPRGKKIIMDWNELGQPIKESGGLLGQFLGHVASDFNNFPISYEKWPKVPKSNKDNVWTSVIQVKFDVDEEWHKKYIMKSLGKKWRDDRSRLFTEYYDPVLSWEDMLKKRPSNIPIEQWAGFMSYRMTEKTKLMTERNINNRSRQIISHTLGSMTIARKRDQIEMENGQPCTRADMYIISHKKKDGSYVNDEARQKSKELQTQTQLSSESDAYTIVFGKEHPGRVRSVGQGVCPSQMFASTRCASGSSSSNTKIEIVEKKLEARETQFKLLMEAQESKIKLLTNALVHVMQQTGASLPPGFQDMIEVQDLGSPVPARTSGDLRCSSSNSHEPQNQVSSSRPPQFD